MTSAAKANAVWWRRAGDTGLRVLAAVPLGYATASLWAMALARWLPTSRAEASVWGALAAFAFCAAAAIWAFAARSGWRAFASLLLIAGVGAALTWWSVATGGRA